MVQEEDVVEDCIPNVSEDMLDIVNDEFLVGNMSSFGCYSEQSFLVNAMNNSQHSRNASGMLESGAQDLDDSYDGTELAGNGGDVHKDGEVIGRGDMNDGDTEVYEVASDVMEIYLKNLTSTKFIAMMIMRRFANTKIILIFMIMILIFMINFSFE